jgi:hypothetical protein
MGGGDKPLACMQREHPGLQIDEAIEFQQRFWTIQRVGWVVLTLFVLAALAGLFGKGPLSSATVVTTDERVEIRHQRFGRYMTSQLLEFRFLSGAEQPTLWISHDIIDAFSVQSVFPQAESTQIDSAGVTYRFAASALAKGASSPAVVFEITPQRPGMIRGSLGASRDEATPVWQFVYP